MAKNKTIKEAFHSICIFKILLQVNVIIYFNLTKEKRHKGTGEWPETCYFKFSTGWKCLHVKTDLKD